MANKFDALRSKMSAESQARAKSLTESFLAEMPLTEVRQARGLSQKTLAAALNKKQPAVAKLEKRADMYISSLRNHIEAMGGTLDVIANFPDGSYKINNFSELDSSNKETA